MINCSIDGVNVQYSISSRLDIVVKYLYALSIINKTPDFIEVDAYKLYHKHIHIRTGSIEPDSPKEKSDITHYIELFNKLIQSFKFGFNSNFPIPISSINGLLLNGAHRFAASLAFNYVPIMTYSDTNIGASWDSDWFKNAGFNKNEIHNIIKTFSLLQKYEGVYIAILWEPCFSKWDDIKNDIEDHFNCIHLEDVNLSPNGFAEFIRDVYSYDYGVKVGLNIERKVDILKPYKSRCRVLFLESKSKFLPDEVKNLKINIRTKYSEHNNFDNFTTIHLTESNTDICT